MSAPATLVHGKVVELPVPTRIHGVVCSNVVISLGLYCRQRGFGYIASNDSGVILERDPDTVRAPDVALYEDANSFEQLYSKADAALPRLAVEVLSPGDR